MVYIQYIHTSERSIHSQSGRNPAIPSGALSLQCSLQKSLVLFRFSIISLGQSWVGGCAGIDSLDELKNLQVFYGHHSGRILYMYSIVRRPELWVYGWFTILHINLVDWGGVH